MDDAKRVAMYREQAEADQKQIEQLQKENRRLHQIDRLLEVIWFVSDRLPITQEDAHTIRQLAEAARKELAEQA